MQTYISSMSYSLIDQLLISFPSNYQYPLAANPKFKESSIGTRLLLLLLLFLLLKCLWAGRVRLFGEDRRAAVRGCWYPSELASICVRYSASSTAMLSYFLELSLVRIERTLQYKIIVQRIIQTLTMQQTIKPIKERMKLH